MASLTVEFYSWPGRTVGRRDKKMRLLWGGRRKWWWNYTSLCFSVQNQPTCYLWKCHHRTEMSGRSKLETATHITRSRVKRKTACVWLCACSQSLYSIRQCILLQDTLWPVSSLLDFTLGSLCWHPHCCWHTSYYMTSSMTANSWSKQSAFNCVAWSSSACGLCSAGAFL